MGTELDEVAHTVPHVFVQKHLLAEAISSENKTALAVIGRRELAVVLAKEMHISYGHLKVGAVSKICLLSADNENLARMAIKLNLDKFLCGKSVDNSKTQGQIEEFRRYILEYPDYSGGLVATPNCLVDVMAAIFGAVYVDSNHSLCILEKVVKNMSYPFILHNVNNDYYGELQKICAKIGKSIKFNSNKELGKCEILLDDVVTAHKCEVVTFEATHNMIDIANNRAAEKALKWFFDKFGHTKVKRERYWPSKRLNILVTGSGGFIASHVARRLKE